LWLVDGVWRPISPDEVLLNAAVMREARFNQVFPQVPRLPSDGHSSDERPGTSEKSDMSGSRARGVLRTSSRRRRNRRRANRRLGGDFGPERLLAGNQYALFYWPQPDRFESKYNVRELRALLIRSG
jgi:hypothetical protein